MPLHKLLRQTFFCFLLASGGMANLKAAPLETITGTALQEPTTTLVAPQGVTARASFVKAIVVRWQAVEGAESYVIERSDYELGIYTEVATVLSSALAYKDQELGLSQTAFYRVKAVIAGAVSEPSPVVSATTNPDNFIRIMPLGDSNTFGGAGVDEPELKISYRQKLQVYLDEANVSYDFVGTMHSGEALITDVDHAGFPGSRVGQIESLMKTGKYTINIEGIRTTLESGFTDGPYLYDERNNPDIILLHIGTNDASAADNVIASLNGILDEVDEYEKDSNKEVLVVVAKIIQIVCFDDGVSETDDKWKCPVPVEAQGVLDFNVKLEEVVNARKQAGDYLELVDMQDGAGIIFRWGNHLEDGVYGDMADARHPKQTGYDKMAPVWYNGFAQDLALVSLPVEITKFNAVSSKGEIELNWSTASEKDNDRFEVERMQEGQPFRKIGTVAGAGNSNQALSYTFQDITPPTGEVYYRLKQVDTDGTYAYSKVVSVRNAAVTDVAAIVYPNPTNGHEALFLHMTGLTKDMPVEVVLLDGFGRKLHHLSMRTSSSGVLHDQLQLPGSLAKGLYILQVNTAARSQSLKLAVK